MAQFPTPTPAFMSWPVPTHPASVRQWQAGRCAMCGYDTPGIVEDHCHTTGKVRGMLCRGCNATEANSVAPVWKMWRAGMNPARLLGEDRIYYSPITGEPVISSPEPTREQMKQLADAIRRIP